MKILFKKIFDNLWMPIFAILLWQLLSSSTNNIYFPSPVKVWGAFERLLNLDWLIINLYPSIQTILFGFMIGSLSALLLGILMAINKTVLEILLPILNFIRGIPSVAKIPIIMALFGIGQTTRICATSIAVFAPVVLATVSSVSMISPSLEDLIKVLKIGKFRALFLIRLPSGSKEIYASLQVGMQIAILVMIVSEFLGSGFGVGAFIIHSQNTFKVIDMWAGILFVGLLSLGLNLSLKLIEKILFPWHLKQIMSKND